MESKKEEEVPSPHKAFVGGISWHTSEKDLREYFTTFGPVAHVNLMTKKRSQQPRGFAFVVFATQDGLEAAVASQRHTILGRTVEVKKAISKRIMDKNNKMDPQKIFAGGLPSAVDDAMLRQHFERFGEITDAIVMIDRHTNRSRGFGFVTFRDSAAAARALSESHELLDKEIEVKRAAPKQEKADPPKPPGSEVAGAVAFPTFGYAGGIPFSGYGAPPISFGVPITGPYQSSGYSPWVYPAYGALAPSITHIPTYTYPVIAQSSPRPSSSVEH